MVLLDRSRALIPDGQIHLDPSNTGPLTGLSFAAKELIAIQSQITGCGNPHWLEGREAATEHAPCITRLLNQGATLKGRTISDEMAFSLDGENVHYGTPINVNAPERIPGGSSSGSAAIVAAGEVDFSLGTDTAGSVRVPSAYCGLYGLRTSHGKISLDGVHPMAKSFDVVGYFARTPEMMVRVGQALLGPIGEQQKPGTLYMIESYFDGLSAGVAKCYHREIDRLKASGIVIKSAGFHFDLPVWLDTLRHIQWFELYAAHGQWIDRHMETFGSEIRGRLAQISSVSAAQYHQYQKNKAELSAQLNDYLSDGKIVLLPTTPDVAPLKGSSIEQRRTYRARLMQHVCVASVAGLPQLTVPLSQLMPPLGLSLMAGHGQDHLLLQSVNAI